jgi:hypothetical protein
LGDFFEKISILEVEIGINGPGILGVNKVLKHIINLKKFYDKSNLPEKC